VDRLAFSVLWDLDEEGRVRAHWAGRSLIRSCAKLSYGHAQAIIETSSLPDHDRPPLSNGATWPEVGPWHSMIIAHSSRRSS
jgi:DIS3-like exonuclease 2